MLPKINLSRSGKLEILDRRQATAEEISANFAEIERVNRYLGGTRAVRNALDQLARTLPRDSSSEIRILDIATGSADIPRSIARQTRRQPICGRFCVTITATDLDPIILEHARRRTPPEDFPEIAIERADALDLPYTDQSFDIVCCSMALHHFGTEDALQLLREMARVSRIGIVVNDLRRDPLAYFLISLLTRLLRTDEITRHDAPLSVLRAYTMGEIRMLAKRADLPLDLKVYSAPMFRAVLAGRHRGAKSGSESL